MPGPMAACARSTGAIGLWIRVRSAAGRSDFKAATNARRVVLGASDDRGRHANTMDEASALVPLAIIRFDNSLRNGHVAVTSQPLAISPSSKVCQPVD